MRLLERPGLPNMCKSRPLSRPSHRPGTATRILSRTGFMKNTLMHCSKRLLLYALVAAGLIQARAAEEPVPAHRGGYRTKCLSAITNLYPNARVISTRGALQIKTRTHDARVPVQFKVSNLPPAYQSVEVPLASDFVLSLRVRPGPTMR